MGALATKMRMQVAKQRGEKPPSETQTPFPIAVGHA
jgi:hypothetical protein